MAKKYIKSHSNYILRSNPSPTENGYVYENDLLTTSQKSNIVNGNMISSTEGGFTFIVNTTPDDKKTYNNDGSEVKSYTLGDILLNNEDFEQIVNLNETKIDVKEKKFIELNKYYADLSKYCYFGSTNAMLNSSVSNIINNFPAGLCIITRENIMIDGKTITIPTDNIQNKFNIDLLNYFNEERVNLKYDLRVLATSFLDFEIVDEENLYIGNIINFTGYTDTNKINITFELSDNLIPSTGQTYIIRPIESKRNEFFNNLDDFERMILNKDSLPKYRSNFKVPIESDFGISFEYKSFIWPTPDSYNIDFESSSYVSFMSELVEITNFIDEIYSDNLYRMLTHDSIKNLDSTYERNIDEERLEEILIGGTKVQKILRLYGRSYDELKKYIEGISFANTITYDGYDNLPNEYLNTKLDSIGWDVFSLVSNIDKNLTTSPNLFEGISKKYTTEEVNNELTKRIIINSKHIFKSKGTKKSIRKMLGLLGFEDNWYEIREYVQLIDNFITNPNHLETIAKLNHGIYPEDNIFSDSKEPFEYSYDQTLFDNTNVGIFVKCPICNSEDHFISGETYGDNNTGICIKCNAIFDITGNTIGYPKPIKNSIDYYFQQKGNWYRETGGNHTDFSGSTNYVNEINYGNNPHIGKQNQYNFGYDNGYDYIDQFNDLFKRFHRNVGERSNIDISGYTNFNETYRRFNFNSKKIPSNKIALNEFRSDDYVLNLKNFVIGIDMVNVFNSYIDGKNENTAIINFYDNETNKYFSVSDNSSIRLINKTEHNFGDIIVQPVLNKYISINFDNEINGISFNEPILLNQSIDNIYQISFDAKLQLNNQFIKLYVLGNETPITNYLTNEWKRYSFIYNTNDGYLPYLTTGEDTSVLDFDNFSVKTITSQGLRELVNDGNFEEGLSIFESSGIATGKTESLGAVYRDNIKLYTYNTGLTGETLIVVENEFNENIELICVSGQSEFNIGYLIPGFNYKLAKNNDQSFILSYYNNEKEFELLKSIALPYIEQLIPATTIFDFILIDKRTPKWKLVDKYLYKDLKTGVYDGDTILVYQNINYFDSKSNDWVNTGLKELIYKDFGVNVNQCYSKKLKNSIILGENSLPLKFENGNYTLNESSGENGFDNIYIFKVNLGEYITNTSPEWEVDLNIID